MTSFFDASDAARSRDYDRILDLGAVATRILHPKKMVQPVKQRGSITAFLVLLGLGCGLFVLSLAAFSYGDPYGLTEAMLYIAGGMSILFLGSYLSLPTRLWYSRSFSTFYRDFCFGMTTMAVALAIMAPSEKYPEYVINSTPVVRQFVKYIHNIPTDKEIDLMARVLYGEARGEDLEGQKNVVHTIINRAEDKRKRFGPTYAEILIRPKAFSCMNPEDPNYKLLLELDKKSLTFQKYRDIVVNTINERLNGGNDPTQNSTHYHNLKVDPKWNVAADGMVRIGNHKFWRGVD
jgi:N-acetylmuramoyl-L-alanine amidase